MRRLIFLSITCFTLCACEGARFGAREKGALAGGALGAGLGAIIGNQVGNPGAGVAIGSAFGALSGGVIGNEVDRQDDALAERDQRLSRQEQELAENRKLIEALRNRGADARSSPRGVVVNFPDVLFEFDSARLTPDARHTSREIANTIRDIRGRHISVEGHTDSIGTVSYNQRLSEDRARSVAEALEDNGVPRGRVSWRGYGESAPMASNSTDSGRRRNRRVEVIIENR